MGEGRRTRGTGRRSPQGFRPVGCLVLSRGSVPGTLLSTSVAVPAGDRRWMLSPLRERQSMALRPLTDDGVLVCVRPPGWVTEGGGPLADLLGWAEQAERLGFDGVFVGDRLLAEATTPGGGVV